MICQVPSHAFIPTDVNVLKCSSFAGAAHMCLIVLIQSFNPVFILKPKDHLTKSTFNYLILLNIWLAVICYWPLGGTLCCVCISHVPQSVFCRHWVDVTDAVVLAIDALPTQLQNKTSLAAEITDHSHYTKCFSPLTLPPPISFILIKAYILVGRRDISIKSKRPFQCRQRGDKGSTNVISECFVYTLVSMQM